MPTGTPRHVWSNGQGGGTAITAQKLNELEQDTADALATSLNAEAVATAAAYSDEQVRDVVAAALIAGTNVTITPDDAGNTIEIAASGGGSSYTDEQVRDVMGTALVGGTNVTVTPDDASNTITIAASSNDTFGFVSILDYGVVGDGSADDTDALIDAIDAAETNFDDRMFVDLAGLTIAITGVTLGNYTKLRNGRIKRHSGTAPLLTLPSQSALQTTQRSILRDLELDGVSSTAGNSGIYIGFHAAVLLENVTVKREGTALNIRGGQFCVASNVKTWDCVVGMYLTTDTGVSALGGGNSWSFYDFQSINNTVGVIIRKGVGEDQPMHSIYFRNPTLTGSAVCALAAFSVDDLVIDGSANEHTDNEGTSASTFVYQGLTVKKSSIHLTASSLVWKNSFISEADIDPCVILDNGANLSLNDCYGYGASYGRLVTATETSSVVLSGAYGCNASVANVRRANVSLLAERGLIVNAPYIHEAFLPNEWTDGQAPTFGDTNGATNTTGTDPVFGNYVQVAYAGSIGSAGSNRARWSRTFTGESIMVAMLMQASTATTLDMRLFTSNTAPQMVPLPTGRWVRVIWWTTEGLTGTHPLVLFPLDSAGATVKIAKAHQVSGADGPEIRSQWNAILAGDYKLT